MILVTGATGNVGSPLVEQLDEASVSFKAFVRDPDRARGALGTGVDLVKGDLAEPATLEVALEGVEVMFLLNGDPEIESRAVDVALRSGVRRVVKQSALAVGLEPPPFHRRIELKLERSRLGYMPPASGRQIMVERGLPAPFAAFLVGFYAAVREGNHDMVTDTVAEVTGRQPYTFDSFVCQHSAAFGGNLAR